MSSKLYICNYAHNVTFINDTNNLNLLPTQILVLPNDPSNPYWNAQCRDCNGIVNGLVSS